MRQYIEVIKMEPYGNENIEVIKKKP